MNVDFVLIFSISKLICEHGVDKTGRFNGESIDLQLERINVYFDEAAEFFYVI